MKRMSWAVGFTLLLAVACFFLLFSRPTQGQVQIPRVRFDDTLREPFAYRTGLSLSDGIGTIKTLFTVPAGKVLVVENVTLAGTQAIKGFVLYGKVNGQNFFNFQGQLNFIGPTFQSLTKFYVGPGEELNITFYHDADNAAGVTLGLTGYYADVLTAGTAPLRTDVNRDGQTTVSDAVAVLRRIVGLS